MKFGITFKLYELGHFKQKILTDKNFKRKLTHIAFCVYLTALIKITKIFS